MEEVKPIKGQPKSFLKKLKDIGDHEEQMAVLGAAVRLGVVILVWIYYYIKLCRTTYG